MKEQKSEKERKCMQRLKAKKFLGRPKLDMSSLIDSVKRPSFQVLN